MKFTIFASGSKGNSCLIESNEAKVLIDCGMTKRYLSSKFDELELKRSDLSALLLTHSHSDHIQQIKHFAQVPTYSPFPLSGRSEVYDVIPYLPFAIGDLKFTPIELSHDTDITVGYVISNHVEKLVYITDTGYVKTNDFALLEGATYYIIESNHDSELLMQSNRPYMTKQRILSDRGHLSNDACGELLSQLISDETQHIVLAHLSQEANRPDLALQCVAGYLDGYRGKLEAAKQLSSLSGGTL